MKNPAQLSHLLLDINFMNKPTILEYRHKFGSHPVLWLIQVYLLMSQATNAEVGINTLMWAAKDLDFDNGEELIDYALSNNLIQRGIKKEHFTNSRVLKDQTSWGSKKEQNRLRQERFKGKETQVPVIVEPSNALVTRLKRVGNALLTRLPDSDSDSDNDNINNNSKVAEFTILTPPETEDEIEAEKHLETPGEGKAWEKDNRWMSAGWRPMKRFPLCWLKRSDLVLVIKRYTDAEVQHRVGAAFRVVQGTLEGRKLDMSGSFAKYPSVVGWLTGYVLSDVLRSETEASRLKRVSDPTPAQRTNHPSASNFVNGLVKGVARSH